MAESSDFAKNAKKAKKCIFLVDPYGTHEPKNQISDIAFKQEKTSPLRGRVGKSSFIWSLFQVKDI